MKTTAVTATFALLLTCSAALAVTYTVNPGSTWNTKVGSNYCGTCTFNISSGQTLTLDYNGATCASCVFNGGNINITGSFACQTCTFNNTTITMASSFVLNLQSGVNTFNNSPFTLSGTSSIVSTAGITITGSTFTFNGTSFLNNNGGTFTGDNSSLLFNGNSYLTATSPIVLKNSTSLQFGDGTGTSAAYMFYNSGTKLIVQDNSIIKVASGNNYYRNGSAYTYNPGSGPTTNYATSSNTISCGSSYPHACQANYVYGCATLNSAGAVGCITLSLAAPDVTVSVTGHDAVALSWLGGDDATADHYTVERSSNGFDWTAIANIAAVAYSNTYRYIDQNAPAGAVLYRLVLTDKDSKQLYSKVYTVSVPSAGMTKDISIYPNPVTGHTFFLRTSSTGAIMMNVYSLSGQLLFNNALKGQTQYTVNVPATIASNSYIVVQVVGGEGHQAFTVMVK